MKSFFRIIPIITTLSIAVFASSTASAISGPQFFKLAPNKRMKSKVLKSDVTNSQIKTTNSNALHLIQKRSVSPTDGVRSFLRASGLQFDLQIEQSQNGLNLTGSSNGEFDFRFQGVRLCQPKVKSTETNDGGLFISGAIPEIRTSNGFSHDDFGTTSEIQSQILSYLSSRGMNDRDVVTKSREKCLFVENDGTLTPAWEVIVQVENLPYFFWVSHSDVLHFENRFFSAVGMTKVFKQNPDDGELGYVTIGNLLGDGTMNTSTFDIDPGLSVSKANSCTHEFFFSPSDDQFAEASALTHATRMLSWYNEKFSYEWDEDAQPMKIRLREIINDDSNNALYIPPATSSDAPQILIGEGDGITLQNLMLDADVVSHEFGHHIVFQSVTAIEGESLVLHEGLADFFTFARTGDPCLGESICPDGSSICWENAQCLRTAENDLKLTDPNLPTAAHLRSQFISGFLWDIYQNDDFQASDLTKTVYRSIRYLSPTSSYEEFVTSLFQAEKDLFAGKHCATIKSAAEERGMNAIVENVTCPAGLVDESSDENTASTEENEDTQYVLAINDTATANTIELTDNCAALANSSKTRKKGKDWTSCGQVGGRSDSHSLSWLLIAFPLLFCRFAIKKSQRNKS